MNSVGFFTPISFGPFVKNFPKALLEAADEYFHLGSVKALHIPGYSQRHSEEVVMATEQRSLPITALKVTSYIAAFISARTLYVGKSPQKYVFSFIVAIPLLMATAKVFLRTIYKFHTDDFSRTPFVGEENLFAEDGITDSIDKIELKDGQRYLLSPAAMKQLKIVPINISLEHNLPQTSTKVYAAPPRLHAGSSQLKKYESQVFEFEYKTRSTDIEDSTNAKGNVPEIYYEVRKISFPLIDTNIDQMQLSDEKMACLKILPTSLVEGYSIRPEYTNIKFEFSVAQQGYSVYLHHLTEQLNNKRSYTFLPFNERVDLKVGDPKHEELDLVYSNDFEVSGEKWGVYTSPDKEYKNSVILTKPFEKIEKGETIMYNMYVRMPALPPVKEDSKGEESISIEEDEQNAQVGSKTPTDKSSKKEIDDAFLLTSKTFLEEES